MGPSNERRIEVEASKLEGQAACAEVLQRLQPRLLSRIRLMMGANARRVAESSDFLQGALLEALRRTEQVPFASEEQFLRWMTAVARNRIRDGVRGQREQAFASLSGSWVANPRLESPAPSPPSHADVEEQQLLLVEALEELSDEERAVVELRNLDELSYGEIGQQLGWSDDRARLMHLRAMSRLGRLLQVGRP